MINSDEFCGSIGIPSLTCTQGLPCYGLLNSGSSVSKLRRFCARLGFGEDIEMAEEKRSRRLGKQRVTDLHQGDRGGGQSQ